MRRQGSKSKIQQQHTQGQTQASKNFVGKLPPSTEQYSQNPKTGNIVQNLSANLESNSTAQTSESQSNNEVQTFLSSIKLEKYCDKFNENGIEDLETILELKDDHLEQIGVPLGHKLKIMKKIKDMRASKGMSVPQSRQGTTRGDTETQANNSAQGTGKAVSFAQTAADQQTSATKDSALESSFKGGQYDEAESHAQFQEAL